MFRLYGLNPRSQFIGLSFIPNLFRPTIRNSKLIFALMFMFRIEYSLLLHFTLFLAFDFVLVFVLVFVRIHLNYLGESHDHSLEKLSSTLVVNPLTNFDKTCRQSLKKVPSTSLVNPFKISRRES